MDNPRKLHERLASELAELQSLVEQRELVQAQERFAALAKECEAAGIRSSSLLWARAVAFDYAGEPFVALEVVLRALAIDPISPNLRRSFDIITEHVREALGDPQANLENPAIARAYAHLVDLELAEDRAHLGMARHQLATGVPEAALRLAQAVTVLSPRSASAWTVVAEAARAVGNVDLAEEAAQNCKVVDSPEWLLMAPASA